RRTRRAGGLQPGRPRAAYRSGEQQQEARLGVGQRVAAKKNAAHDAAEQPRLCDHQHGVEYSGSNRDDEVETRDPCFSKQASVEVHESKIRQVSGREGVSPQMSQMEPQCYLCPSVLSVGSFKMPSLSVLQRLMPGDTAPEDPVRPGLVQQHNRSEERRVGEE